MEYYQGPFKVGMKYRYKKDKDNFQYSMVLYPNDINPSTLIRFTDQSGDLKLIRPDDNDQEGWKLFLPEKSIPKNADNNFIPGQVWGFNLGHTGASIVKVLSTVNDGGFHGKFIYRNTRYIGHENYLNDVVNPMWTQHAVLLFDSEENITTNIPLNLIKPAKTRLRFNI